MMSSFFANLARVAAFIVTLGSGRSSAEPVPVSLTTHGETTSDVKSAQRAKQIEERRQILVERHTRSGLKLRATKHYEESSDALARSYALAPSAERLLLIAEVLRRADLDRAALLVHQRLMQAEPPSAERHDLLDALAVLRAKLGEQTDDAFESATLLRMEQERAHHLCQQGSYEACGSLYARVYALKPLPRLLFNVAQAARRAGQLDESMVFYSRFLEEAPPSPLRKEATQYIAELGEAVFRRPVYKQWWLWTSVLVGASAIIATGLGASMASRRRDPQTDLGTQSPMFMLTY